jgi:AcrR family transcriptional regulator
VTKPARLRDEIVAFKRNRIVEEATHLFFEDGYEQATLDRIAGRLAVTKPFLYSYFQNKAELLEHISSLGIDLSLAAQDEELAAPGTPSDKFIRIVERVSGICLDHRKCIVVYQREEKNLEPQAAGAILQKRHSFDRRLAGLLREGQAAGQFDISHVGLASISIGGLMSWIAFWYQPGGRFTRSDVIHETCRMARRVVGMKSLD